MSTEDRAMQVMRLEVQSEQLRISIANTMQLLAAQVEMEAALRKLIATMDTQPRRPPT